MISSVDIIDGCWTGFVLAWLVLVNVIYVVKRFKLDILKLIAFAPFCKVPSTFAELP